MALFDIVVRVKVGYEGARKRFCRSCKKAFYSDSIEANGLKADPLKEKCLDCYISSFEGQSLLTDFLR